MALSPPLLRHALVQAEGPSVLILPLQGQGAANRIKHLSPDYGVIVPLLLVMRPS